MTFKPVFMLSKERTTMFEKNESATDRIVRVILGGGLLATSLATLGAASGKPLGIIVAVVGAVLLFTAATGTCLLYKLFGLSTARQH